MDIQERVWVSGNKDFTQCFQEDFMSAPHVFSTVVTRWGCELACIASKDYNNFIYITM